MSYLQRTNNSIERRAGPHGLLAGLIARVEVPVDVHGGTLGRQELRADRLLGGGERTNSGTIFLPLKDFGQRPPGGEALARQLNAIGMTQPDGMCLVVNPPAIRGIGTAGGFEFYLQAKEDDDPARLAANIEKLEAALRARQRRLRLVQTRRCASTRTTSSAVMPRSRIAALMRPTSARL